MWLHSLESETTVHDKEQYIMLRYFGKYWKGGMKQACSLVANIVVDKKQVVHYLVHCELPFAEQNVFAAQHCFLQPQHPDTPCPALPRL
jgi:hypothetical protein